MALSLLFSPQRTRRGMIGEIELDATLSERHEFANAVTDHPVERGAAISDHVYAEPDRVSIDGVVSNSPIRLFGFGLEANRAQSAFDALLALHEARSETTIVTAHRVYEHMVMVALSMPRDPSTGQAVRFTADFRQIRTVETQSFSLPAEQVGDVAIEQAPSLAELGNQVPIDATAEVTESASWALQLYEGTARIVENLFPGGAAGGG